MFKRLLDKLTGSKESPAPAEEMITAYDVHGREIRITRSEWRDKMLKPQLDAKWNAPDELYGLVVGALNDGLAAEVDAASEHLLAIDPIAERGHVIRAIVLMELERFEEAKQVLHAAAEKVGETASILTNLAKVEEAQGASVDANLWKAITLDPNFENALGWWVSRERERGGEAGYVAALEKVASLHGSWRAPLWLGGHALEQGDVEGALARFRAVLAGGTFDGEALMLISGELGNAGRIEELVAIVAPAYDPSRHAPQAGLNLLRAYLHLDRLDEAEALLERLYPLLGPPFKPHLDAMANELQEKRGASAAPRPVDMEQLQIGQIPFDRPIWHYGLREPAWLLPAKPPGAPRVLFLMLAKASDPAERAEAQREDALGRLSRAIPLYLAESAWEWTPLAAQALVPVVMGGGPVLFGAGDEDGERETAMRLAEFAERIVQGTIGEVDGRWTVSLRVWEVASGRVLAHESFSCDTDGIASAVLALESKLLPQLATTTSLPHDAFYARPSAAQMQPHLDGLAQLLMQALVSNKVMPRESLWGERNIIEWPMRMALQWPEWELPRAMFYAALSHAARYQSVVLPEFEERARDLVRDMKARSSPLASLEPLALRAFGRGDAIAALKAQTADPARLAWIERVESP